MQERAIEDVKREFEEKTGKKIKPFDVEVMGGSDEDKAFETFMEYHEHLEQRVLELKADNAKLMEEASKEYERGWKDRSENLKKA